MDKVTICDGTTHPAGNVPVPYLPGRIIGIELTDKLSTGSVGSQIHSSENIFVEITAYGTCHRDKRLDPIL